MKRSIIRYQVSDSIVCCIKGWARYSGIDLEQHMRIHSIAHRLGEDHVSNEDVVGMIRDQSTDFSGDLDDAIFKTRKCLDRSGFETRRWMPKENNLFQEMQMCIDQALQGIDRSEIDNVIHVGVGRHFMEPTTSSLIAKRFGLEAHCFDIFEACQSWTRAMHLLDGLYRGGAIQGKTLVVNCEVHARKGIAGADHFGLESIADLEWKLPTYTMGDSITATVFEADDQAHDWAWKNLPECADLCYLPLPGAEDYDCFENMKEFRELTFACRGMELHQAVVPHVIDRAREVLSRGSGFTPDHVFTHTSSPRAWSRIVGAAGVEDRYSDIARHTGNLVSASIPTAISMAIDSGSFTRGQDALVLFGSAGASALAYRFRY